MCQERGKDFKFPVRIACTGRKRGAGKLIQSGVLRVGGFLSCFFRRSLSTDISDFPDSLTEFMKPYYEHGGITIYHGDCWDVLPEITADFILTDPPYKGFT